jgi:hypothetical protein
MSELSSALGGSVPNHQIVCNGKTYHVSLITQAVKVAFERTLYQKAREALGSVRDISPPVYYEKKLDALLESYQQGKFAMESEFGKKAMANPGGGIMLLSLLMGETRGNTIIPLPETEIMAIAVQVPDEASMILRTVMRESFPGVDIDKIEADIKAKAKAEAEAEAEADADPKAQASDSLVQSP